MTNYLNEITATMWYYEEWVDAEQVGPCSLQPTSKKCQRHISWKLILKGLPDYGPEHDRSLQVFLRHFFVRKKIKTPFGECQSRSCVRKKKNNFPENVQLIWTLGIRFWGEWFSFFFLLKGKRLKNKEKVGKENKYFEKYAKVAKWMCSQVCACSLS